MDVITIIGTVATILATGTVGAVSQRISQRSAARERREERREEREEARAERHRSELREAYATYIAAETRFLDRGDELTAAHSAMVSLSEDAYDDARRSGATDWTANAAREAVFSNSRIATKHGEVMDAWITAATEVDHCMARVVLIEDHDARRVRLAAVTGKTVDPPQSEPDYERFRADLKARRALLLDVIRELEGAFSARTLSLGESSRSLPGASQQQLTSESRQLQPSTRQR